MFFSKKNSIIDIYEKFKESDMNSENSAKLKRGIFTFKEYNGKIFLWDVDKSVSGILTIPNGVSVIYDDSIKGLKNITGIEMSNSVQVIGDDAINFCRNLRYVNVSANIVYMGLYAIRDCDALTRVKLPQHYKINSLCPPIDKLYEDDTLKIIRF